MAASTDQLHTFAIEAEKNVEQLATGLAQVGADPNAVKAVTQCASILRKIAVALAKGGTQDQPPADQQPQSMDDALNQHFAARKAAQQPPA